MQNQLESKAYAGFFVRLIAYGIDMLIAVLAAGMVKAPFSIAASSGADFLKSNFIFDYSFLDVLGYVGIAAYFVLLTYFAHTTVGKMLFHLEVSCGKEWTFVNILYRETIGRFLSSLLNIGYLAIIVQKEKQGFHDMLCDTHVVYKNMYECKTRTESPSVITAGEIGGPSVASSETMTETFSESVTEASAVQLDVSENEQEMMGSEVAERSQAEYQPEPKQENVAESTQEQMWTYHQPKMTEQKKAPSAFELTESHCVDTEKESTEE